MLVASTVRRFALCALGLLVIVPRRGPAQAAVARPAAGDSIYRLAVDSNAYKEYPFVYLLDDGVVRFESDGRGVSRYHQIVQILKAAGVNAWAERSFSYRPGHTKVTINAMRVVRPSGEVVSDKPTVSQTSDVPAAMSNPIYVDTKVLRYSLGGVAPGTIVDIDWTDETTDPYLRGDFSSSWRTTMDYPALRSRFVVDIPSSVTPRIVEHHVDIKRHEEQSGGRHYYVWAKQSVVPVKGELFAPDSSVPRMTIDVSSPLNWSDIARWYSGLAKDRYALSPRAIAMVDSVVRNKRTADDTLRALHEWIAKDIRYVSVSLGIGGYQPRFPDSTIVSGVGDCKDKATLFIAAARHLGMTAYPVLLNSTGVRDKDLPSIGQFDHAIAALQRPGKSDFTFLDLTTSVFPAGTVPPSYQGEFGIVVMPDGSAKEITFPTSDANTTSTVFEGELSADGKVSGRLELSLHGPMAAGFRQLLGDGLDSTRRAAFKQTFGQVFPNNVVDTIITPDPKALGPDARLTVVMHGGDGVKRAGTVGLLALPGSVRPPGQGFNMILAQLSSAPPRKYPVDASKIVGNVIRTSEFRIKLPEGWKAQLPKSLTASSIFGDYRSEYTQEGRVVRIAVRLAGTTGVYPKERIAELEPWLKSIGENGVDTIVLLPPSP